MSTFDEQLAEIEVQEEWRSLPMDRLTGTVLVVGGPDSGKTTLVRYLIREQLRLGRRVGWLDADPGQSVLGLPGTLNLAFPEKTADELPRVAATFFVGSTSPRGHMLPLLTGLRRLQEIAREDGCESLVIDTSGLVDRNAGGGALKEWEMELLRPQSLIAVQHERELEHMLAPLRHERRLRLHVLTVAGQVQRRGFEERSARRQKRFRKYFAEAQPLRFSLGSFPVYGLERERPGQLLAFLDESGLVVDLGVMRSRKGGTFEVLTPASTLDRVAAVRFGALAIDPETGDEL